MRNPVETRVLSKSVWLKVNIQSGGGGSYPKWGEYSELGPSSQGTSMGFFLSVLIHASILRIKKKIAEVQGEAVGRSSGKGSQQGNSISRGAGVTLWQVTKEERKMKRDKDFYW